MKPWLIVAVFGSALAQTTLSPLPPQPEQQPVPQTDPLRPPEKPESVKIEPNYNSGGVVANESAQNARVAHVTVYHDAQHASMLEVPIVR